LFVGNGQKKETTDISVCFKYSVTNEILVIVIIIVACPYLSLRKQRRERENEKEKQLIL
jgi:ribosome maturation protein Sdo1